MNDEDKIQLKSLLTHTMVNVKNDEVSIPDLIYSNLIRAFRAMNNREPEGFARMLHDQSRVIQFGVEVADEIMGKCMKESLEMMQHYKTNPMCTCGTCKTLRSLDGMPDDDGADESEDN